MSGGVWIASYVMLWVAVVVLGLAVIALLRQVGVLHGRLAPLGAHFGGEGPDRLAPAPPLHGHDYAASRLTLVAFTSPGCTICTRLRPGLRALQQQYGEVEVRTVELGPGTEPVFAAFRVRSTPYFVTVDGNGIVRGRGIANSLEQIEVLLDEALSDITQESSRP